MQQVVVVLVDAIGPLRKQGGKEGRKEGGREGGRKKDEKKDFLVFHKQLLYRGKL